MKYIVIAVLALAACEETEKLDPEALQQCKDVLKHIVQITPQSKGQDPDKAVAALPFEDLQACVAVEPEVRACMLTAADVPAVKLCIPGDDKLACMKKASKAKNQAHAKATQEKREPDPALDKQFDDLRAKCWAGETKAADDLKLL